MNDCNLIESRKLAALQYYGSGSDCNNRTGGIVNGPAKRLLRLDESAYCLRGTRSCGNALMCSVIGEQSFQGSDGSSRRAHPTSGIGTGLLPVPAPVPVPVQVHGVRERAGASARDVSGQAA